MKSEKQKQCKVYTLRHLYKLEIKGVTHAHLELIWYHSEPSDVPYSPNQFLALDFFCRFLQQHCSNAIPEKNVPNYLLRDNGSNFHLGRQVLLSPRSLVLSFVSYFMQKIYIFSRHFTKPGKEDKTCPLYETKKFFF